MRRIGLGLSLVAAGFVTAVMIAAPAFDAAAQMGGGGMQGQGMMQHGAETPATQAYMAAMMRMHNDMAIQFTGDPDVDFARGMIPHHQGAIDLSRVALQYGRDPEIRALAEKIIKDQEEEIGTLRQWLEHHPPQAR